MTFKRTETPELPTHRTSVPELVRRWGGTLAFVVAVIAAIKEVPVMVDASHEALHALPAIRELKLSVDSMKEGKTAYQKGEHDLLAQCSTWQTYVGTHRDSITHAMPSNVETRKRLDVLEKKNHIGLIESPAPRMSVY